MFALALAASSVPMFTVSMNNLVTTSALPSIGQGLHIGVDLLQWVFSAYVLVFAGGLLASAALGDRFGNRRVFLFGVVWYGAASLMCGMATTSTELIAGRALQGAGAAAILPLSLSLLTESVSEQRRSLAVGIWSGLCGFSLATGGMIGGAVTSNLSWRWIFWINIPVALIAVPLVLLAFSPSPTRDRRPDIPGMLLLCVPFSLVVWATSQSQQLGWWSTPVLAALAAAVAGLIAFAMRQRRVTDPLIPLPLYRNRQLMLVNLACLTLYFGVFGSVFFLMQYLQGPLGFSPWGAGIRTLPWTAMPLVTSPLTGLLIPRIGGGRVLIGAALMQALGLGWIALIATPGPGYARFVLPMIIAGAGMGMEFSATNSLVIDAVGPEHRNLAVSTRNTAAELGGVFGVAALTTVYQVGARYAGSADPNTIFVAGLVPAIVVGAAVVLVGALAGAAIARLPAQPWNSP
jgi:EmrB/QacA subfamily drug resistance transporter